MDLRRRLLPAYRFYWLPLRLRLSSTTFFYDLLLRPASTSCLYVPLRVIVHLLFKWNVYLSLYVILYVLLFLGIIFLFSSSNCAVEGCAILLLLIQPLPCFANYVCFIFAKCALPPLA